MYTYIYIYSLAIPCIIMKVERRHAKTRVKVKGNKGFVQACKGF